MRKPITGRQVLFGFVGFFGLIFAANGVMMWQAFATFDGVAEADAYRKGRDYNEVLAAAEAQAALDWQLGVDNRPWGGATTRTVTASYRDAEGRPLEGLRVTGAFVSPIQAEEDLVLPLAPIGGGRYQGVFELPRLGNWQLRIDAAGPDGVQHRSRKALFIAASDR